MVTRRALVLGTVLAACVTAAVAATPRVRMFELYEEDLRFSALAEQLKGQRVAIQGFMAPHLKVDARFFILSSTPVETCPFCAAEADWTDTIVFVRPRKPSEAIDPGALIVVEGKLEIGAERDPETGFVSKVRLTDAEVRRAGK